MTMQFLYRIQPARLAMLSDGPTASEEAAVGEHFAYLQDLLAKGSLLMAGRTLTTDESSFGVVVFQADSESGARELMGNDPAVRSGVMRAELFPYRVALWSVTGPHGRRENR